MMNGVHTTRIRWIPTPSAIPLLRGISHFVIALFLLCAALTVRRPHVIYTISPPLTLGLAAYVLSLIWSVPYFFKVEDIFPQYAIDLGKLKSPMLIRLFRWMERFVYRHSTQVIVHSTGNQRYIVDQTNVDASRVTTIPNWVDTTFLSPGPHDTELRHNLGLDGRFVVLFAGTMGWSQNLSVAIDAARRLRNHPDICFLLVGDGVDKVNLERSVSRLKLDNVILMPMQPLEAYPELVRSGNVSLVTLSPDVATPVVPGKLSSIMACQRPVIASLPLDGDAAKLVRDADCGICVPPGNGHDLADAILELRDNEVQCETLARNGRRYAKRYLERHKCVRKYENIFDRFVANKQDSKVPYSRRTGPEFTASRKL